MTVAQRQAYWVTGTESCLGSRSVISGRCLAGVCPASHTEKSYHVPHRRKLDEKRTCRITKVIAKCYSTPAIAASTASTSAPRSLPLAAAPAPGEALAQPGPFSRQSLGFRLTPSFKSRMPAALSETAIVPEGQEPRSVMTRFLSNL